FLPVSVAQTTASKRPTVAPQWTESQKNMYLERASRGDRSSQFWLGAAYEQGWLGKPDFNEAVKWFRKAAKQGDPDAQVALGQMYEDGEGVPQNYATAAKWYRKAAEHVPDLGGAGQGRNQLGLLYMEGQGVPKDYVLAYMWFRLAHAEPSLAEAKSQMTSKQVEQAELMAADWKRSHPER